MLKLSLLTLLLIGPLPYSLHLLTTTLLLPLLLTMLLLFIVGSLKSDRMLLLLTMHTPQHGISSTATRRSPLKKQLAGPAHCYRDLLQLAVHPVKQKNIS
jgi:hypothetical protein